MTPDICIFNAKSFNIAYIICGCSKTRWHFLVREVLFNLLFAVLLIIHFCSLTVAWWLFVSHDGLCTFEAYLFFDAGTMPGVVITQQEITLRMQFNLVQIDFLEFLQGEDSQL